MLAALFLDKDVSDTTKAKQNSIDLEPKASIEREAGQIKGGMTQPWANRPQVCFESWGDVPADDPGALPLGSGSPILGKFLQKGFHLVNDGGAAHEITVETFEIEQSVRARSKTLRRIAEKGKGFAYVWLEGYPPWSHANAKWDLVGAMARASDAKYGNAMYRPDYSVEVSVVYRDADRFWHRSTAEMNYIGSQGRIEFGPTTQRAIGKTRSSDQSPPILSQPTGSARNDHASLVADARASNELAGAPKSTGAGVTAERAAKRQTVVNPILQSKRWRPGRLATKAGVGKNSVYEYLNGTRAKITDENRVAIAQALDLEPEQLPD